MRKEQRIKTIYEMLREFDYQKNGLIKSICFIEQMDQLLRKEFRDGFKRIY